MTNATNNTADGSNGTNKLSAFAIAMSDVFALNAKVEGTSVKLLQAMYDSEVTFHLDWLKDFAKAGGKDKTAMLDKVLSDMVPSYADMLDIISIKLSEFNDATQRAKMAEKKADAQRKLKTAQNTLRNVTKALTFLRLGPGNTADDGKVKHMPVTKIDVKNGKVRFATEEGWFSGSYSSIADLTKFGENCIRDMNWTSAGTPRAGNAASNASSVKAVADKAKATGGYFQGAINDLSKAIIGILGNISYDKLSESELESLRNLETALITKVYADDKGFIDLDVLSDTFDAVNKTKIENEAKNAHRSTKKVA